MLWMNDLFTAPTLFPALKTQGYDTIASIAIQAESSLDVIEKRAVVLFSSFGYYLYTTSTE
jgi:hypothetical protein